MTDATTALPGVQTVAMRTLTIDDAFDAAAILAGIFGVHRVELFGSFARDENHKESDLDFILCTDDRISERFFDALDWSDDWYALAATRFMIAMQVLDTGLHRLDLLKIYDGRLDLFIFPMDWRNRLETLQWAGGHRDEDFMVNIARDALPLRMSFKRSIVK